MTSSAIPFSSCLQSFPGSFLRINSLHQWPKYGSFIISPSNEYSGLISFRMDWLDLLAVQGTLKSLVQNHNSKASILWCSAFFIDQLSHSYMLLLLSLFSRIRLCDPIDSSPPGSPFLGFSRQEHWSGLPFPSPMHASEKWKWSRSVVSDSLRPHGLQSTRLLHPWDFPGKSTGVGCHGETTALTRWTFVGKGMSPLLICCLGWS